LLVPAHEIHGVMTGDLLGRVAQRRAAPVRLCERRALQRRAPDPLDDPLCDMGFSRAGQGLMISTVTVASP